MLRLSNPKPTNEWRTWATPPLWSKALGRDLRRLFMGPRGNGLLFDQSLNRLTERLARWVDFLDNNGRYSHESYIIQAIDFCAFTAAAVESCVEPERRKNVQTYFSLCQDRIDALLKRTKAPANPCQAKNSQMIPTGPNRQDVLQAKRSYRVTTDELYQAIRAEKTEIRRDDALLRLPRYCLPWHVLDRR